MTGERRTIGERSRDRRQQESEAPPPRPSESSRTNADALLAKPKAITRRNAPKNAVLPQITLTLTNAVIVTAALARELFPASAEVASERNLALSSGFANVLLCPFGAMPMCHGAGGLQAQYRYGARTGLAPIPGLSGTRAKALTCRWSSTPALSMRSISLSCGKVAEDSARFRWSTGSCAATLLAAPPQLNRALRWASARRRPSRSNSS